MPALHELQERVAGVLLGAQEPDSLGDCLLAGRIPLASRLAVHRNTVRGGLCQALRLRYPSVARLLGEDGFDRAALAFAAGDWPRAPQLGAWGAGFADFLATDASAGARPWLHDVARFDALLDALGALVEDGSPDAWHGKSLGSGIELALAPSLRRFAAAYPVDEIRAAVAAEGAAALTRIDLVPQALQFVAWRCGATLKTRRVGAVAAAVIDALAAALSPADALELAAGTSGLAAADLVAAVQREVLAAPFAVLRASAPGNV